MQEEYTLSIIKPDATKRNIIGQVNSYFEKNNLKIVAQKMIWLTKKQAETFYAEHKDRPFFGSLIESMASGPIVVQVLKGVNAIEANRIIMGKTNPAEAEYGTIRKDFGLNIEANTVHGSDSNISALREIGFFFAQCEIVW